MWNLIKGILGTLGRKLICVVLLAVLLALTVWGSNFVREENFRYQELEALASKITQTEFSIDSMQKRIEMMEKNAPSMIFSPLEYAEYRLLLKGRQEKLKAVILLQEKQKETMRVLKSSVSLFYGASLRAWEQIKGIWLYLALIIVFGPLVWKLFCYYLLAPGLDRYSTALQLNSEIEKPTAAGTLSVSDPAYECFIKLALNQHLFCRMSFAGQRQNGVVGRTKILWSWKSILVSMAAGLVELTEFIPQYPDAEIILTSPENMDSFIVRLDLADCKGLVLKPSSVVALSSGIKVRSQWACCSLNAILSGRIRYIIFYGTGSIFVNGHGGVNCRTAQDGYKIEEEMLLGFESNLKFKMCRTETFWPFLREKSALFDYVFSGNGRLLTQRMLKQYASSKQNIFIRGVGVILNGIGKLLGF